MNCLLESVATLYIGLHQKLFIRGPDDPLQKAREDLEVCKWQLEERSRQLTITSVGLCQEALAKRRLGEKQGAILKFQEYKRCQAQLTKVTNGIQLLNQQLDVLNSNDVDKQIMLSLKQSSQAMRAAGIQEVAGEADGLMVDLSDQLKEASTFTSIIAAPLESGEETEDLEQELAALMEEERSPAPAVVSTMNGAGVREVPVRVAPGPSATGEPVADTLAPQLVSC